MTPEMLIKDKFTGAIRYYQKCKNTVRNALSTLDFDNACGLRVRSNSDAETFHGDVFTHTAHDCTLVRLKGGDHNK